MSTHFAAAKARVSELSLPLSDDILNDVKLMAYHAAWHTAYLRVENRDKAASQAKIEFENLSSAIAAAVGEISPNLADEIKWLCWRASWHTANARKGNAMDAKVNFSQLHKKIMFLLLFSVSAAACETRASLC